MHVLPLVIKRRSQWEEIPLSTRVKAPHPDHATWWRRTSRQTESENISPTGGWRQTRTSVEVSSVETCITVIFFFTNMIRLPCFPILYGGCNGPCGFPTRHISIPTSPSRAKCAANPHCGLQHREYRRSSLSSDLQLTVQESRCVFHQLFR